MRTQTVATTIAAMALMLVAATPRAATLHGTVMAGGIYADQTGDRSTTQETYDLEDKFALTRLRLTGSLAPRSTFLLDVRDVNLRSRAGEFLYRVPGTLKLTAGYDQNRYVFNPDASITSERKDWRAGLTFTPSKRVVFSGDFNRQGKTGERIAYPVGTASVLGTGYDDRLLSGGVGLEVRNGRRGAAVSFRMSDYADALNSEVDRQGKVVSARVYAPMPFWDRWNNLLRASYGTRELKNGGGLEYKLYTFQYTGILQPRSSYEVRYRFDASRVDDQALALKTDRFQNDLDVTWYHENGQVTAGYGYELNDDDRTLTSYQSWRAGATVRPSSRLTARVNFDGRTKNDKEDLTLLKDIEASRLRADLDVRPIDHVTLGGDVAKRTRELTDIGVKVDGTVAGALARFDWTGWGALSANYSYALDEYTDRLAGFDTQSDIVTARLEVGRIPNLRLAGGFTYLDIGKDLDIEKWLVFAEGSLKLRGRYHLEAKYNCYNYDDYILLDRYYTANVVRVEVGYDL